MQDWPGSSGRGFRIFVADLLPDQPAASGVPKLFGRRPAVGGGPCSSNLCQAKQAKPPIFELSLHRFVSSLVANMSLHKLVSVAQKRHLPRFSAVS